MSKDFAVVFCAHTFASTLAKASLKLPGRSRILADVGIPSNASPECCTNITSVLEFLVFTFVKIQILSEPCVAFVRLFILMPSF